MCSNFEMIASPTDLASAFGLDDVPELFGPEQIWPTDPALAITGQNSTRQLRFGIEVPWDKAPLINARSETVMEKPTFRALLENRCLIPATAWFEWRKDGKAKFKNRIYSADQKLMTFGALFDGDRFVLLTRPAIPSVSHIHHRMPVLLDKQISALWLNPDIATPELWAHLNPAPDLDMQMDEIKPPPSRQGELFI